MSAHLPLLAVSVCICTFNRERLLRQTLAHVARLVIPDDVRLEVVVVDNNSKDGTAAVIAEVGRTLPFSTAVETIPGIAAARNRAVALATGDLLVWIDDDVLVDPGWLPCYVAAARAHPEAAFFGGPVRPYFEGTPPSWVHALLLDAHQAFALREFPEEVVRIDSDHLPYGANFAVRRQVHERVPFNPALGRVGKEGGCLSEESAFFEAAMALGYQGRWLPDCPVRHVIPAERQTTRYLRGYYRIAGATPVGRATRSTTFLGRPRWLWREWLQNELLYRLTRYTASPSRWFAHLKRASYAHGALFRRAWR